jgi:hypothetical protein
VFLVVWVVGSLAMIKRRQARSSPAGKKTRHGASSAASDSALAHIEHGTLNTFISRRTPGSCSPESCGLGRC